MIQDLVRVGRYEEAAIESVSAKKRVKPDSANGRIIERLQADISIASGLSVARDLSLGGRDVEALDILRELDAAHPGTLQVEAWRERTELKLSDEWFETARAAVGREDFDAARAAYRKCVEYEPSRTVVEALLKDLDRIEDYRASVAEDLYYKGVRDLADLKLSEARQRFGAVNKYARDDPRAKRRITETDRFLAKERAESAEKLAKDNRFAAAAKEYAAASKLDPSDETIAKNASAFEDERKAQASLTLARSMMLRQEYDGAETLLRETLDGTVLQRESIEQALKDLDEQRTDRVYQRALDLSHDFQFEAARKKFSSILESREFYKDTRARIDAIDDNIALAKRLYEEAKSAADDSKRLESLRKIEVFWPDYRDIAVQITSLSKRVK